MGLHYVPQKYLEGFCDSDGQIYQYEKGSLTLPARTWPRKVAQKPGFYPPDIETELNLKIEVPANRLLKQLKQGQLISSQDKIILAKYIVNLMMRTPTGWARVQRHAPEVVDKVFDDMKNYVIEQIKMNPDKRYQWEYQWEKMDSRREEYKQNLPRDYWYPVLLRAMKSAKVISNMVWAFYSTDKPAFLTSDNPVSYPEREGISNSRAVVTFPISSTIALEATYLMNPSPEFHVASSEKIHQINQRTIQGATRYIFHCESSEKVLQLVNA